MIPPARPTRPYTADEMAEQFKSPARPEREQTCPSCGKTSTLAWDQHLAMCSCGRRYDYHTTLMETRRWVANWLVLHPADPHARCREVLRRALDYLEHYTGCPDASEAFTVDVIETVEQARALLAALAPKREEETT